MGKEAEICLALLQIATYAKIKWHQGNAAVARTWKNKSRQTRLYIYRLSKGRCGTGQMRATMRDRDIWRLMVGASRFLPHLPALTGTSPACNGIR